MRKVAHSPARKSRQRSPRSRSKLNVTTAAAVAMFLDLPAVADRDCQVMPPTIRRRGDQCPHVRFRAAAVMMNDVQDGGPRAADMKTRLRRLAQRTQRIGGNVTLHHVAIMRVPREQPFHVPFAELRLATGE